MLRFLKFDISLFIIRASTQRRLSGQGGCSPASDNPLAQCSLDYSLFKSDAGEAYSTFGNFTYEYYIKINYKYNAGISSAILALSISRPSTLARLSL
jgi:hypothetical protein